MSRALFNIAYTLPSPPPSLSGNNRADYTAQRKFYDMTAEYNYFSYTLNKQKVVKNKNAEDYFTKSDTNTGLFNLEGNLSGADKDKLKAKLKETQSIIWHGFISFDQETSQGFTTQENAVRFMRQTFRDFLKKAGFRVDNIELYAALHDDTPIHHHIHFAFFEKEPKRLDKNGVLGFTRRGKINPVAIDNYLVSANMHLSENGAEYYSARDAAMATLNVVKKEVVSGIKRNMPLNLAITQLMDKLPKEGRLQYRAESIKALKADIDRVAEMLIATDEKTVKMHKDMLVQFVRVEAETRELSTQNKLAYVNDRRMTKEEIRNVLEGNPTMDTAYVNMENVTYFKSLKEDYKARVGNVVLGMCKDIMRGDLRDQGRRSGVNDKGLKMAAKRKSMHRNGVVDNIVRALQICNRKTTANFIQSVQEIEHDMELEKERG